MNVVMTMISRKHVQVIRQQRMPKMQNGTPRPQLNLLELLLRGMVVVISLPKRFKNLRNVNRNEHFERTLMLVVQLLVPVVAQQLLMPKRMLQSKIILNLKRKLLLLPANASPSV